MKAEYWRKSYQLVCFADNKVKCHVYRSSSRVLAKITNNGRIILLSANYGSIEGIESAT